MIIIIAGMVASAVMLALLASVGSLPSTIIWLLLSGAFLWWVAKA